MKVQSVININEAKIKAIIKEELSKFEFAELDALKTRINKLEETVMVYKRLLNGWKI